MEEQEIKKNFRKHLVRLVAIDDWIDIYTDKLFNVENELANLDLKKDEANLKTRLSLAKQIQALQHISDILCVKIHNLRKEKTEVQDAIHELSPNGIMDDGYYSEAKLVDDEIAEADVYKQGKISEKSAKIKYSEEDIKAFKFIYPDKDLHELSEELNIEEDEIVKFSKEYVAYAKAHSNFKHNSEEDVEKNCKL